MTAAVSSAPLSFARRYRARNFVVALIVVVVLGLLWVFAPNFFKINNLINISGSGRNARCDGGRHVGGNDWRRN